MTESLKIDAFGDCSNPDCDQPMPWDMAAVGLTPETVCCSPDCARKALHTLDESPETATLHDPQGAVDRESIGVDEDAIDIVWSVGDGDIDAAIRQVESLYPGEFRITDGDTDE